MSVRSRGLLRSIIIVLQNSGGDPHVSLLVDLYQDGRGEAQQRSRHPVGRSTVGADGVVGLDRLLELEAGDPLGWKHLGLLDQADALDLESPRWLAPVRRFMWHASVTFADDHELGAFLTLSVHTCQQVLKSLKSL